MSYKYSRPAGPLIGITLDSEKPSAEGYSKFPWYALRSNYSSVVVKAGGIPIILPHEFELVDSYLDLIDGLIITGGNFDIDPALYGETATNERVNIKPDRTQFEMRITREALQKDIPILGICGGQQLLNVALGGTLIQHIPDEVNYCLMHEQQVPRDQPGHIVTLVEGTLLHEIVGTQTMNVNTAHHQAVKEISDLTKINSRTSDGVVEGIEAPSFRFCLGVQWHPEFEIDPGDLRIFEALINATK